MAAEKPTVSDEELEVDQEVSDVNEKALLRKLDLHLLPALTLLYLLSFLDRSNGRARTAAFQLRELILYQLPMHE